MKDVIVACDFSSARETYNFLDKFTDVKPYVKIGMELFYSCGPVIVREIKARGHKIFLDLKLHDIPNTVRRASAALGGLGADMANIHAAGGGEMLRAALEGFRESGNDTLVIAVTQLTSISAAQLKEELLIDRPMEAVVARYAANAKAAGLGGVVCSPFEARAVKEACGEAFAAVTPGIRFADSAADDQTRIATPAKARELGSDYIVVGRPITKAEDPIKAYKECVAHFLV